MKRYSYNYIESLMFAEYKGRETEFAKEVRLALELQEINEQRAIQGLPLLDEHPETV